MLNKLRKLPLLTIASICLFAMVSYAVTSVEKTNSGEQKRALEDAIMRSAIHCYSIEGSYPMELSYLEEYYNLAIDEARYIVHYEMFASNLAPDITVIDRASQTGGTP